MLLMVERATPSDPGLLLALLPLNKMELRLPIAKDGRLWTVPKGVVLPVPLPGAALALVPGPTTMLWSAAQHTQHRRQKSG